MAYMLMIGLSGISIWGIFLAREFNYKILFPLAIVVSLLPIFMDFGSMTIGFVICSLVLWFLIIAAKIKNSH